MKTIHIYYDGPIDLKLDALILKAMAKAGFKWYGEGCRTKKGRRDIAFDSPGQK